MKIEAEENNESICEEMINEMTKLNEMKEKANESCVKAVYISILSEEEEMKAWQPKPDGPEKYEEMAKKRRKIEAKK